MTELIIQQRSTNIHILNMSDATVILELTIQTITQKLKMNTVKITLITIYEVIKVAVGYRHQIDS